MKKKSLLVILLIFCSFICAPKVIAASASTTISGSNSVKVGNSVDVYINLNTSAAIEGVDITYGVSGNIKVTNVAIGSGLTNMSNSGNRYILYANSPIPSGSTILKLTIQGVSVGSGTVSVSNLEATVSGSTVASNNQSFNITVNPAKTAEEIAREEQARKEALEREKKEAEARQKELEDTTKLVEKAEDNVEQKDYERALTKVNNLPDGEDKSKLLARLEEVKFKIAVNEACKENDDKQKDDDKNCVSLIEEPNNSSTPWIILSIILFVALVGESIYIIVRLNKKNRE